ncbi:hypothetical protein SRHO_G00210280 [Serrasalmus rhombeus]
MMLVVMVTFSLSATLHMQVILDQITCSEHVIEDFPIRLLNRMHKHLSLNLYFDCIQSIGKNLCM